MNRGGTRPGAGRPFGTTKPDSRKWRLTQRYNDADLKLLEVRAHDHGFDTINEYIRAAALGGV
jgi:hypothetical protein